jgi:uncharacterized membrane protein
MAFCGKCGSTVTEGVAFCPQCGAPVGAAAAAATPPSQSWAPPPAQGWAQPPVPPMAAAPASGLQENVAGLLCYVLGWITGIIFLLIDKRPFVRFHAAQSLVVFGALFVVRIVLTFGFFSSFGFFSLWSLVSLAVSLVTLVLWIMLMVFAYPGKWFAVPVAANIAKSIAASKQV